jgi:hypothetical protein
LLFKCQELLAVTNPTHLSALMKNLGDLEKLL